MTKKTPASKKARETTRERAGITDTLNALDEALLGYAPVRHRQLQGTTDLSGLKDATVPEALRALWAWANGAEGLLVIEARRWLIDKWVEAGSVREDYPGALNLLSVAEAAAVLEHGALPAGAIPFGTEELSGNYLVLDRQGRVRYWDHESPRGLDAIDPSLLKLLERSIESIRKQELFGGEEAPQASHEKRTRAKAPPRNSAPGGARDTKGEEHEHDEPVSFEGHLAAIAADAKREQGALVAGMRCEWLAYRLAEHGNAPNEELDLEDLGPCDFTFHRPWLVYPRISPGELTPELRRLLMLSVDLKLSANFSLTRIPEDLRRYLGVSMQGPSDTTIRLGDRQVPLWWAVTAVASGGAKHEDVLAAWRQLPAVEALAAYAELASGRAYDVTDAQPIAEKDVGYTNRPYQKQYRDAFISILADVSVAFGAAGERAACALIANLADEPTTRNASVDGQSYPLYPGAAQAFVALLSGVRHAAANKAAVDPGYDMAFSKLWQRVVFDAFHTNKAPKEIKKGLPAERAALFEKALSAP